RQKNKPVDVISKLSETIGSPRPRKGRKLMRRATTDGKTSFKRRDDLWKKAGGLFCQKPFEMGVGALNGPKTLV
ncbi:hypothetical protein BaRGS_00017534, partial [Batillaria attramentaria]